MARVRDGQTDFSGGMVDRIAPERLQETQYAYGKNVEIRYGGVRSRRGSWRVRGFIKDDSFAVTETTGFHVFNGAVNGQVDQFIWASLEEADTQTYIRRSPAIGDTYFTEKMTTPATMNGKESLRFVQGYNNVYAFRDGLTPWRWTGDPTDVWEDVPEGTSGVAPLARDGLYAFNRLWLIEGDDTVIPSDLLDENWDRVTNEFRVEQGDGTRLVTLRPFAGGSILAFKERGIALIRSAFNFTDATDLVIEFISDRIGTVAADTVVNVGNDVFFLGREGVWTIRQTTEQNAQLVELPLSEPIYGLMQDVNWTYADTCSAVQFDNYYILAVPVGGSTVPNRLIAYDLLLKSWVGFWEFDDGAGEPYAFAKLTVARLTGPQELVAVGHDGTINILLRGDYQDFVGSGYWDGCWKLNTELSAGVRSEFSDGYIEFRFRTLSSADLQTGYKIPLIGGPNAGFIQWYSDTEYLVDFMDCQFRISSERYKIYGARWYVYRFAFQQTDDPAKNILALYINGALVGEYIYATDPAEPGITSSDPFWVGAYDSTATLTDRVLYFDYVDIATTRKSSSSIANPHRILMNFHDDGSGDAYAQYFYGANNSYSDVLIVNSGATLILVTGSAIQGEPVADGRVGIESIIKTRGYHFGDLFEQKNGLRGECRFAHGQPSVTAVLGSDVPFDTETLASLNAKTYSLTDYEIVGRSAWTASNANNDFQTPYREDYAPIALSVQMGAAGLVLDKWREHTELFSSLAIFGWAQFTLTNTQGYVRYNGLRLTANGRPNEQDTGNNGY